MTNKIKPIFKETKIFYGMKRVYSIGFPLRSTKKAYTIEKIRELAKQREAINMMKSRKVLNQHINLRGD